MLILCPVLFLLQYVGAPVAYIQQIFVKSSVSPWHKNLLAVDVFRSPLSRAFQLVEEIRNHVLRDRYSSQGLQTPEYQREAYASILTIASQSALQFPGSLWVLCGCILTTHRVSMNGPNCRELTHGSCCGALLRLASPTWGSGTCHHQVLVN